MHVGIAVEAICLGLLWGNGLIMFEPPDLSAHVQV
jgi:hypothetical protein